MKMQGAELSKRYIGTVHIPRVENGVPVDLQIRVEQLSPDWDRECARQLVPPVAPIKGRRQNPETGAWEPKQDEDDPQYKDALAEYWDLVLAKRIHDGTIDDRITWETDRALLERSPREYYAGIWRELAASFTRPELAHWGQTIMLINTVAGGDVALARDELFRFVSEIAGNEAGIFGVEPEEVAGS